MKKLLLIVGSLAAIVTVAGYLLLGSKMETYEKTTATGGKQYMIILGAKVKPNGDPSPTLQARLDAALHYLQQHEHVHVVVAGGKGPDEPQSEASAMLAFLKVNGIARHRIIVEDKSTSTYENLLFTRQKLPEDVTELTIVSNDFHLARAQYLAHKLGFETDTIAAPTPKSVEWQLRLRERVALFKTYIVGK